MAIPTVRIMQLEDEAFLREISAAPEEDTPRLIYADWLEERGERDRADFIRTQCSLERVGRQDPCYLRLRDRQAALYQQHRVQFERPFKALGVLQVSFRRGLPQAIRIGITDFLANADKLFALAPLTEISLEPGRSGVDAGAAWGEQLASLPHMRRVESLSLHRLPITPDTAAALARSPYFERLNALNLSGNRLTGNSLDTLAGAPWFSLLRRLAINDNRIGDESMRVVSRVPFCCLKELGLERNRIGPEGILFLSTSGHMNTLERLLLTANPLGDAAALALSRSPGLRHLRDLVMDYTQLTETGVIALETSHRLRSLRSLSVEGNSLSPAAERAVRARFATRKPTGRGG